VQHEEPVLEPVRVAVRLKLEMVDAIRPEDCKVMDARVSHPHDPARVDFRDDPLAVQLEKEGRKGS
jgi:hypothetical protein